jgi:hypothetical protein
MFYLFRFSDNKENEFRDSTCVFCLNILAYSIYGMQEGHLTARTAFIMMNDLKVKGKMQNGEKSAIKYSSKK